MSTVTYDHVSRVGQADDRPLDEDYSQEVLRCDQLDAEQTLWDLQRELRAAKLALQAEIWDLRAEVHTLHFNAIVVAGDLDKLVSKILNLNAANPHDPNC